MKKSNKLLVAVCLSVLLAGGGLVASNIQDVNANSVGNPWLENNISQIRAVNSGSTGSSHGTTVGARTRFAANNGDVTFSPWGTAFAQSGSTTARSNWQTIRTNGTWRAEGFLAVGP